MPEGSGSVDYQVSKFERSPTYRKVKDAITDGVPLNEKGQKEALDGLNRRIKAANPRLGGTSTIATIPIRDNFADSRGYRILSGLGMLPTTFGSGFGENQTLSGLGGSTMSSPQEFKTFGYNQRDAKTQDELSGVQATVTYERGNKGGYSAKLLEIRVNQQAANNLKGVESWMRGASNQKSQGSGEQGATPKTKGLWPLRRST